MPRSRPAHHLPDGRFHNPWSGFSPNRTADVAAWMWNRARTGRLFRPPDGVIPAPMRPAMAPHAPDGALHLTWLGHSSFLLQCNGLNILTDPMFSARASPLSWIGPRRLQPSVASVGELPPIDLVLLSHDHYDHFDDGTVRALARRFPDASWCAPLGVAKRLRARGARTIHECDWWDRIEPLPSVQLDCVPAQHFSGRTPFDRDRTLWCGWTIATGTHRICFVGDSGLHPEFERMGLECGPFDLILMPIGAYEPRYVMQRVHMNPDEAVAAYASLIVPGHTAARAPVMAAMHWGTFALTDEPVDEPPRRAHAAWLNRGLDPRLLWILAPGEMRALDR